jgi:hypothetical protein
VGRLPARTERDCAVLLAKRDCAVSGVVAALETAGLWILACVSDCSLQDTLRLQVWSSAAGESSRVHLESESGSSPM